MEISLFQLIIFGVIAALANVLGGLILFPVGVHKTYKKLLKYILALGAGFMLAVSFIDVLPEVIELWLKKENLQSSEFLIYPMILLLGGYLLTQFFEHTIAPHFHLGEEVHAEHLISTSSAYTAIGGLLIHTFFDGVSVAAAFLVDRKAGLLFFVAILLHKVPEGFTAASIMLASGRSARRVLFTTLLIGAATLAGVLSVIILQGRVTGAVAYALPFSAGVTLYVAASDLIPEVNHMDNKNPLLSLVVFGGVVFFYLLHYLIDG